MGMQFKKTVFAGVTADLEQKTDFGLPEIILTGRSNVGKSSLINALAENRHLARTSSTPGKTRLAVHFIVDGQLLLTDLPGYGFAAVSKKSRAAFASLADQYVETCPRLALVLYLLDIRHLPAGHDRQMLAWLLHHGHPCRFILTKADQISRHQIDAARRAFAEQLFSDWLIADQLFSKEQIADQQDIPDLGHIIAFSAKSGMGVELIREAIRSAIHD